MKTDKIFIETYLKKYLTCDNALELGVFNGCELGLYSHHIKKFAKNLTSIDISNDALVLAEKYFKEKKIDGIKVIQMNAADLKFNNSTFDVVVTASFHEMDPSIQNKILCEADRVLKTPKRIVFMEPNEDSVTNELFKVFDPNENHAERIKNTKKCIENFAKENNYKINKVSKTLSINQFNNKQELLDEMLNWWSDIKVPKNKAEKQLMQQQIENILLKLTPEYYLNNQVNEIIWCWILEKEN